MYSSQRYIHHYVHFYEDLYKHPYEHTLMNMPQAKAYARGSSAIPGTHEKVLVKVFADVSVMYMYSIQIHLFSRP